MQQLFVLRTLNIALHWNVMDISITLRDGERMITKTNKNDFCLFVPLKIALFSRFYC